jgi:hypothetical protein
VPFHSSKIKLFPFPFIIDGFHFIWRVKFCFSFCPDYCGRYSTGNAVKHLNE